MPVENVVELGRITMQTALVVGAPVLAIATVISLAISIVQVLTSVQDPTVATVPRLLAAAIAAVLLMPWMLRQLGAMTVRLFGDFHPYLH
jgi:flagellar biosynthetic protein FliQ